MKKIPKTKTVYLDKDDKVKLAMNTEAFIIFFVFFWLLPIFAFVKLLMDVLFHDAFEVNELEYYKQKVKELEKEYK
jgi:hypothetical protein